MAVNVVYFIDGDALLISVLVEEAKVFLCPVEMKTGYGFTIIVVQ
jgi:hypothetical protein